METRRYDEAFLIVIRRHLQHRVGVLVQPVHYREPQNVGNARHVKIAPGIYYYES